MLATWPDTLSSLSEKENRWAKALLALIFFFTASWLINANVYTPMYTKLVTDPLSPTTVLPIPGGVVLHMVLQHWFQLAAILIFAVWPAKFATLTQASQPAGIQCAIVNCQ